MRIPGHRVEYWLLKGPVASPESANYAFDIGNQDVRSYGYQDGRNNERAEAVALVDAEHPCTHPKRQVEDAHIGEQLDVSTEFGCCSALDDGTGCEELYEMSIIDSALKLRPDMGRGDY